MRLSMQFSILSVVAASLLVAPSSRACWGELDVSAAVRGADLIVSGRIIAIDSHHLTVSTWSAGWFGPTTERTAVFDRAHFEVTKMLVGDSSSLEGSSTLLALVDSSAAARGASISASSPHSVGEEGIWLFNRDDVFTGLYKVYPLMPLAMDRLGEVVGALGQTGNEEQGNEAPDDTDDER